MFPLIFKKKCFQKDGLKLLYSVSFGVFQCFSDVQLIVLVSQLYFFTVRCPPNTKWHTDWFATCW